MFGKILEVHEYNIKVEEETLKKDDETKKCVAHNSICINS